MVVILLYRDDHFGFLTIYKYFRNSLINEKDALTIHPSIYTFNRKIPIHY